MLRQVTPEPHHFLSILHMEICLTESSNEIIRNHVISIVEHSFPFFNKLTARLSRPS